MGFALAATDVQRIGGQEARGKGRWVMSRSQPVFAIVGFKATDNAVAVVIRQGIKSGGSVRWNAQTEMVALTGYGRDLLEELIGSEASLPENATLTQWTDPLGMKDAILARQMEVDETN